jgi:hypothetical protein
MDRFDIAGLVAGFALSLVIGAVLYVYLAIGQPSQECLS